MGRVNEPYVLSHASLPIPNTWSVTALLLTAELQGSLALTRQTTRFLELRFAEAVH
jgi:hypothetical protein